MRHLTFIMLLFIVLVSVQCSPTLFPSEPDADVTGKTDTNNEEGDPSSSSGEDYDAAGPSSSSDKDDDAASDGDILWDSLAEVDWTVAWTGYGLVTFDDSGILMEPMASTEEDETHSSFVLSNQALDNPVQDFKITLLITNQEHLRTPTPNTWEVFWLFFNFTTDDTYDTREGNYFILKTNGIELGTYENLGVEHQTFLATENEPQVIIGVSNEWVIEKQGQVLNAWIDGVLVMTYDGTTEDDPLLDQAGTFGLYTEDARVLVHSVEIMPY